MKQSLIAFAKHFEENSREVCGLRASFCLRSKLREYSFFYPLYLIGLRLILCVEIDYIDDPIGKGDGYIIKKTDFSKLK